jgi:hypothetical protein
MASGGPGFDILKRQRQWEAGDVSAQSQQLWLEVQQMYGNLERYSDQAQLQLQYELFGNLMLESMPMSVAFDRPSGSWHCRTFRSLVFGDRQHMAMSVKEAATNSLDRQVKVIAKERDLRLLAADDPVARIYLSGVTDLPLSEKAVDSLSLLPPQLEWLQAAGSTAASNDPTTCTYRGFTIVNDFVCVKLARMNRGFETEYWIDLDSKYIRKVVLANTLLQTDLAEAPEVRGLQIQIDFAQIAVNQAAGDPANIKEFPQDRAVRRFVKIPEAFPSPWIGRSSPVVSLQTHEQATLRVPVNQRLTIGLFLSQVEADAGWWQLVQKLATESELNSAAVVMVLDGISASARTTNVSHATAANSWPQLVSNGAEAWQTLGLNQGRWLVVWDSSGTVQYAGPADFDGLIDTTRKVVQRLTRGEAIGEEMIREYQAFYSEYLQQLELQRFEAVPTQVGFVAADRAEASPEIQYNP